MNALQHCLLLQEEITDQARAWEARREETEKAIAEQPSMSLERQQLRNVLALEQRLILALEKLMDANQDAINRLDSLEMMGRGKAG